MKDKLLVIAGFLLLGVGAIGIFLPILPTTPFILVAAACFSGNRKLSAWLHKSSFFSDYITNYQDRRGLKKSTVYISLTFLWATLGLSSLLAQSPLMKILLSLIGVAVTVHILYMSMARKAPGRIKKTFRR